MTKGEMQRKIDELSEKLAEKEKQRKDAVQMLAAIVYQEGPTITVAYDTMKNMPGTSLSWATDSSGTLTFRATRDAPVSRIIMP